jgi:putative chitinase
MISPALLTGLYGRKDLTKWVSPMMAAIEIAGIKDELQLATFLAQVGHESGRLKYTSEIWGPTQQQLKYELGTELAKRLGNVKPGDGSLYRGRGLIQTTGRTNYQMTTVELKKIFKDAPNFIEEPKRLEEPFWAAASAGLFWRSRKLNNFVNDFPEQTRRINGGYHGMADRQLLLAQAKILLAIGN